MLIARTILNTKCNCFLVVYLLQKIWNPIFLYAPPSPVVKVDDKTGRRLGDEDATKDTLNYSLFYDNGKTKTQKSREGCRWR